MRSQEALSARERATFAWLAGINITASEAAHCPPANPAAAFSQPVSAKISLAAITMAPAGTVPVGGKPVITWPKPARFAASLARSLSESPRIVGLPAAGSLARNEDKDRRGWGGSVGWRCHGRGP